MNTLILFAAVAAAAHNPGGTASRLVPAMRFAEARAVRVEDPFWSPRFDLWRTKTIGDVFDKLEAKSHAVNNFDLAAKKETKGHYGAYFFDGLLLEAIRGACDYLARYPSPELDRRLDGLVDHVVAAQEPDGYLNTGVQVKHPQKRWGDNGGFALDQHEIYDAGCLVEAGVHHFRATGKTKLLAAALRFANLMCDTMGPSPKRNLIPTHSLAEEALLKLAAVCRERPEAIARTGVAGRPDDYERLVKFWFDRHGSHCGGPDWRKLGWNVKPEIVEMTKAAHAPDWRPSWGFYQMDRVPLACCEAIEGHAVRATLLCNGLAAHAVQTGDAESAALAERFWTSMVGRKMYLSGGVGADPKFESYVGDYELPPDAYLETCAAIASAFFSGNMAALTGDGKYMDELERVVYNALLTAVGEDGVHYTYQNPLNTAKGARWDWHGCPCCPPMFLKLTGTLPGYAYSSDADGCRVNLFIGGETTVVGGPADGVRLVQKTRYPEDGAVSVAVHPGAARRFALRVRVPGWSRGIENPYGLYRSSSVRPWSLRLNGQVVDVELRGGYAVLAREWKEGDEVTLTLDVSERTVRACPQVKEVAGRFARMRGPLLMATENGRVIPYYDVANRGPAPHEVWVNDQ